MKSWRVALALSYQRYVHADEIRLTQCFFQRGILDPGLLFLNAAGLPKVHSFLYRVYILVVLISRIVAKNIHIESSTFLDHGQADTAGADNRDGFAGDFIAQEGQIRMPEAPIGGAGGVPRRAKLSGEPGQQEKSKPRGGLGQEVGGIRKRDLVA